MPDAPTRAGVSPADESATAGRVLTKEALTSGRSFKRITSALYLPELDGELIFRGISFKEQRAIQANLPDTIQGFKIKHTAFTVSRYVIDPVMNAEEWTRVLSKDDFPATAVTRINKKIAEIMDITDEEEQAVADEFPGTED